MRQSAIQDITYHEVLKLVGSRSITKRQYRYVRPSIVQFEFEIEGDTEDRAFRFNISDIWNPNWNRKRKTMSEEDFALWVGERVADYHIRHPEVVIRGYIDGVPPKQLDLL